MVHPYLSHGDYGTTGDSIRGSTKAPPPHHPKSPAVQGVCLKRTNPGNEKLGGLFVDIENLSLHWCGVDAGGFKGVSSLVSKQVPA